MAYRILRSLQVIDVNIPKTPATADQLRDILALVFAIAGGVAVLFIVIGGLKYVISGGNPQETTKAKETIIYAAVGLLISSLAFVIVTVVVGLVQR